MTPPQTFHIRETEYVSPGESEVFRILGEGVEFSNGKCVLSLGKQPILIYDSVADALASFAEGSFTFVKVE